jgi:hypothetical protein
MRSTIKSEAEATARYPNPLEKEEKGIRLTETRAQLSVVHKLENVLDLRIMTSQGTFGYDVNITTTYLTVVRGCNIITDQAKYYAHKSGHACEGVDLSNEKINPAAF